MAATKPTVERTYTIPLRKEYLKVPYYLRTKKSVATIKKFLTQHLKSDNIKIGTEINEALWQRSASNPPPKIKVTVTKDEKGLVKAELFGAKENEPREKKKKTAQKTTA